MADRARDSKEEEQNYETLSIDIPKPVVGLKSAGPICVVRKRIIWDVFMFLLVLVLFILIFLHSYTDYLGNHQIIGREVTSGLRGPGAREDQSCRNLTEADAPDHGGLVCYWNHEENSQQCATRCDAGYEYPSRSNIYESCGPQTRYNWTHEVIGDCIVEFLPGLRLEGNTSYFIRNCRNLTSCEKEQVKKDFAKILADDGVCEKSATCTKVCDPANMKIICGATNSRRRREVSEKVNELNADSEIAKEVSQTEYSQSDMHSRHSRQLPSKG